ncbi:porin [Porphyromonas loveana]|uniref:porin n=1 Tax=Porphyromonas loveana TaxID=1884669 RepID=UPI00359FD178
MKLKYFLAASILMLGAGSICAQQSAGSLVNTIKERMTFSGYAQAGYTSLWYPDGKEMYNYNTFDVKRIVLRVDAAITDKWSIAYFADFGKGYTTLELYTAYKATPEFGIRLGQFKTAYTIENQLSPATIETITCGSAITNFLAAGDGSDPLMGAQSGRDIGIEVYGDLSNDVLSYRLGVVNGQGINRVDASLQKTLMGSLTLRPFENLSFTGSFMSGKTLAKEDLTIPFYEVETDDLYDRLRWSVGGMFRSKYFDLRSEYLYGKDDNRVTDGFYVTGVARLFKNIDLIASYDYMDLYRLNKFYNVTAGLQYWFYPKCRLQVQYAMMDLKGPQNTSHAIMTQVQVGF